MAKSPPSFDLYPGDLIKSCIDMSAAEFGAYMRLLCYQWEHGAIPSDKRKLARITGMEREEFTDVWESISSRFDDVEGENLKVQERLAEQRLKSIATWTARREGGKKGGRPKSKDRDLQEKKKPKGLGEGSQNKTSTEEGRGKKEGTKKEKEATEIDDWNFPAGFDTPGVREALDGPDGFVAMRDRIKKPVRSKRSTSKTFKHFDSVEHLIYAIDQCTANQWQGIKPDYRPPSNGGTKKPTTFAQQRIENSRQAVEDFANG
jgi:uncharacterized protein YdaU (DUF1376 family)